MPKKKAKNIAVSKMAKLELDSLEPLREISYKFDSPDPIKLFEAMSELAAHPVNKCLLPKIMDLLSYPRQDLQQSAFTVAARGVYGPYVGDFFNAMKSLNPAVKEQVLQSVNERFSQQGSPTSAKEQKTWVSELSELGRGHQPIVFSLMKWLGKPGIKWTTDFIRNNIKGVSLGAVPSLSGYPEKDRKKLLKLLCGKSSKDKREMLPEICGIVDEKTVSYLSVFLKKSTWEERAHIADAISKIGIRKASGLVMELVGDKDWQVKQALVEELNIADSNFASLVKVLGYLITETHSRVRSQTERVLLRLGLEKCSKSTLKDQREKLQKKFRSQLLKAARANRDIDTKWLGIDHKKPDPISEILKRVSEEDDQQEEPKPEGVSLADLAAPKKASKVESDEVEEKAVLLSALLGAKKEAQAESPTETHDDMPLDPTLPAKSKFMLLLQQSSEEHGKDVPLDVLLAKAPKYSLTDEELLDTLKKLEEQGIIYRSDEGKVSYVDFEM
jgi:hypothetical protein